MIGRNMPEYLTLLPPGEALTKWLSAFGETNAEGELIDLVQALGRVTVEPVIATYPLPEFPRSTMDGYAVRAADTFGASDSLPAYLSVIGEVPMGGRPGFSLKPAQAALIHTGGMLPEGADAVAMLEYTQSGRAGEVEVLRAVAPAENIIRVGEDVEKGQMVIPAGVRLRPAEIGGLAALGIQTLRVARQPRIAVISSGDEVVPLEAAPSPGQVRDVNSYTLSALIEVNGGLPRRYGIVPDNASALRAALDQAIHESDAVVITAGSSASTRDLTAQVIQEAGAPGVLVHGVNVRPGKPTILAVCGQTPVVGLPGNPVSALVIAGLFVVPLLERLQGLAHPRPQGRLTARLSLNIPSLAGREDWIPVTLSEDSKGFQADPIFFKSNLIFNLSGADGLLYIPAAATGVAAGEMVEVHLF
jgi:molybdopterin molybdotransferase